LTAGFNNGLNILTLEKYKDFILSRADIKHFFNEIQFFKRDEEVIDKSNILVIARRPRDQQKIINKVNNQNFVIIEKPIAISYSKAKFLIKYLNKNNINYRIGFTLLETPWYSELKKFYIKNLKTILKIEIKWFFNSYHYQMDIKTWKRKISEGGGAFSFYGCHILSLLASIDNWNVKELLSYRYTEDDEFKFNLNTVNNNGINCDIVCNSNFIDSPCFIIHITSNNKEEFVYRSNSPFDKRKDLFDDRVPILSSIINSFNKHEINRISMYNKYLKLLDECERKSLTQIVKN
jgi:hypothetical protein